MEHNEFKRVSLKNCMCNYFNDIVKFDDFGSHNILLDQKSYETIFVYDILYKTFISAKPLRIRFDKIDGFIKVYDGRKHFVLFGPEKYDIINDMIIYLIGLIDSYNSLLLEETLTLHNAIINKQ